jgi:CheY-like chemotaxis protein
MLSQDIPISKQDVQYNPDTQEVTLKREKFDALISFMRDLVERQQRADDLKDIAEYRVRKAESSDTVFSTIMKDLHLGWEIVDKWLKSHSIKDLSERTGIPYATCYRIVTERRPTRKVSVDAFAKLVKAASGSISAVAVKDRAIEERAGLIRTVLLRGSHHTWQPFIDSLQTNPIDVVTVSSANKVVETAKKSRPDLVIFDARVPNLKGSEIVRVAREMDESTAILVVTGKHGKGLSRIAKKGVAVAATVATSVIKEGRD